MSDNPLVLVQTPSGQEVMLRPGDIIGRLPSAALWLNHPQISEIHAHIRLRGEALQLVFLRGSGQQRAVVDLAPDQRILLAPGIRLDILEVVTPRTVLALRVDGAHTWPLGSEQYSLLLDPPSAKTSYVPDAPAHLWRSGEEWMLQVGAQPPRSVQAGITWSLGGHRFELVEVSLAQAALPATQSASLVVHRAPPGRDMCRITRRERSGAESQVELSGKIAELLHELAQYPEPAHWEVIAGGLWPAQARKGGKGLSDLFHVTLRRLRRKLAEEGIDPTLIHGQGGQYGLRLSPGDIVEDRM